MKVAEPGEVIDIALQAIRNAPADEEGLVADELPSMLRAKGINDVKYAVEDELSRVVPQLAEADAKVRKALQARTILRYDAETGRRNVMTGQPARHLVDPNACEQVDDLDG